MYVATTSQILCINGGLLAPVTLPGLRPGTGASKPYYLYIKKFSKSGFGQSLLGRGRLAGRGVDWTGVVYKNTTNRYYIGRSKIQSSLGP